MIKKILGSFIIGLGLLNISYGGYAQIFDLGLQEEILDGQGNDFTFRNGANFSLNNTYKVYSSYISSENYPRLFNLFWTNSGLYYVVGCGGGYECTGIHNVRLQGYITHYCTTGYISTNAWTQSCGWTGSWGNISDFYSNENFKNPNSLYIASESNTLHVCFNYEDLNQSICLPDLKDAYMGNHITGSLGITYNPLPSELGTSDDQISRYFSTSVFGGGGNGNGGTTITRTSGTYYCPTFREVLQNYGNKYNTGYCYNSTIYYDNGQINTTGADSIFTVFTDYTEYKNRISIYHNNCNYTSTQANCNSAFNGNWKKYSIIANMINNNLDEKKLRNYCNIGLNYDLSQTTCTASGYIAENPTAEEILEDIANQNITISTPSSGNILNDLINGNINTGTIIGSGNREDIATRDIFGQLDQIKEKISNIFVSRSGTTGIIPDYILRIILTTILLTILIKK